MEIFQLEASTPEREGGRGVLFGQNINNPLPSSLQPSESLFRLAYRLLQQVTGRDKIFGINFPIFHSILTVIDATV